MNISVRLPSHVSAEADPPTDRRPRADRAQAAAVGGAVAHWIEAHSKRRIGSPREVYFADFNAAGPNDAACDTAFPLA